MLRSLPTRPGKQWVAVPLGLPVLYITGLTRLALLGGALLSSLMRGWAMLGLFIMVGLNFVSRALSLLLPLAILISAK